MRNINALAKAYINEMLKRGEIAGSNKNCLYYPCHFPRQDCTWCFCPFYPCHYEKNGRYIISGTGRRIWDCSKCVIIHDREVAKAVLLKLKKFGDKIEKITSGDLASAKKLVSPGKIKK